MFLTQFIRFFFQGHVLAAAATGPAGCGKFGGLRSVRLTAQKGALDVKYRALDVKYRSSYRYFIKL